MKRHLFPLLALVLLTSLLLTSCFLFPTDNGGEDKGGADITPKASFSLKTASLSEYLSIPDDAVSSLQIEVEGVAEVTDEDVQAFFNEYFSQSGYEYYAPREGEETATVEGDLLYLSYCGITQEKLDNAAQTGVIADGHCTGLTYNEIVALNLGFSNGTTDYPAAIELGSSGYIDGFESGLLGLLPSAYGEDNPYRLHVTFPADYNETLGGKEAVFFCALYYVADETLGTATYENVPIEFANAVLAGERETPFADIDDALSFFADRLNTSRNYELLDNTQSAFYTAMLDVATFYSVPDALLEQYVDDFLEENLEQLQYYYENYLYYYYQMFGTLEKPDEAMVVEVLGYTDNYREEIKANMLTYAKQEMIYYFLMRHAGTALTAEDIAAYRARYILMFGQSVFDGVEEEEISTRFLADKFHFTLFESMNQAGQITYTAPAEE